MNLGPFGDVHNPHVFHGKASVGRGFGNHGTVAGQAVTLLAFLAGVLKEILVAVDPRLAVHIVNAVGAV